jgi:uncharacterized protein
MMRGLFWLLMLILGAIFVRNKFGSKQDSPKVGGALRTDRIDSGEAMHCCAHCGVYVPASESVSQGDQHYCCEQHLRLHHK